MGLETRHPQTKKKMSEINLPVIIRDRLTIWGYGNNQELFDLIHEKLKDYQLPEKVLSSGKANIEEAYDDLILMEISDYQAEGVIKLIKQKFGGNLGYIHSSAATHLGALLTVQKPYLEMIGLSRDKEPTRLEEEIVKLFPRSRWKVMKFLADHMDQYFD